MCFDGALRVVVFLACSPCTASASSSCFRGPWPMWSRSFLWFMSRSAIKLICILRVTYLVCYASWRDLSETKKA